MDTTLITEARALFRRGYAWIDACANVGLSADDYPYDEWVTAQDERANEYVWSYGWHVR